MSVQVIKYFLRKNIGSISRALCCICNNCSSILAGNVNRLPSFPNTVTTLLHPLCGICDIRLSCLSCVFIPGPIQDFLGFDRVPEYLYTSNRREFNHEMAALKYRPKVH